MSLTYKDAGVISRQKFFGGENKARVAQPAVPESSVG